MLSAVIRSKLSYWAMQLAPQPKHQRFVHPSPRVLGTTPLKFPTPTEDRNRTVLRRSKPSSHTTLNGEQPYPWDRLQPQDVMSRHRGAKLPRRCGLLGGISLLSPAYLLSVGYGPSIRDHRIIKTYFRNCSNCHSHSKARLCLYTLHTISDRIERTFVLLRYSLGGYRPSKTTHHAWSLAGA